MLILASQIVIGAADLCAAFLFMFGLKRMSSPATAPSGIRVAGIGMIAAVLASFLYLLTVEPAARPHMMVNIGLAVTALLIGGVGAWFVGRKVAMTAMPQMVAIYLSLIHISCGRIRSGARRLSSARSRTMISLLCK